MINTIAKLLDELIVAEKKKLDEYELDHRPTIGDMYEGLTSELLEKTIPTNLDLRVESGVIVDHAGKMTGQIDCMLVTGIGEAIPKTSLYKWHIKDVIAVFEVKKTLYGNDLKDAFVHLREVHESQQAYVQSNQFADEVDVSDTKKNFARTLKKITPSYPDLNKLPLMEQHIFHTLLCEQISPVRVILGYGGFRSEYSFRESVIHFIQENIGEQGFGVASFPQLIISGDYSIFKANGHPYSSIKTTEYWDFYLSSSEKPATFLLEFIWSKLSTRFDISGLWTDDLNEETQNIFVSGRVIEHNGRVGWDYMYTPLTKTYLEERETGKSWSPVSIDSNLASVLIPLQEGREAYIDDPSFDSFLEENSLDKERFIAELLSTGFVALSGTEMVLITENLQICWLPTGEVVGADNNSGRLTQWVQKNHNSTS